VAFRAALRGHFHGDAAATRRVEAVARRARLSVALDDEPRLVPQARGLDGALGTIVAVVYEAMRDGTWSRLKACPNCGWAFWDESRNRSATWCSMQLCGNRLKIRRYRRRRARPRAA
jgi:predicted RNA-binding Zn ribbon-like protein